MGWEGQGLKLQPRLSKSKRCAVGCAQIHMCNHEHAPGTQGKNIIMSSEQAQLSWSTPQGPIPRGDRQAGRRAVYSPQCATRAQRTLLDTESRIKKNIYTVLLYILPKRLQVIRILTN